MTQTTTPPMPRLTGPRDLHHCQGCGTAGVLRHGRIGDSPGPQPATVLRAWREHDEKDQPEPLYVLLCKKCEDKIIEPHPRLYAPVDPGEPSPGVMPACIGCRFSAAVACRSPLLKANGGPGLPLRYPPPSTAFVDGRRNDGRRFGHAIRIWAGPVRCDGRQQAEPPTAG